MKYSIIRDGVVDNVITADESYILTNHNDDVCIAGKLPIGWQFVDNKLIPPATAFAQTDAYVSPSVREITTRAFYLRLSDGEFEWIQTNKPTLISELNADTKVNLDALAVHPRLDTALNEMETAGVLKDSVNAVTRKNQLLVDG